VSAEPEVSAERFGFSIQLETVVERVRSPSIVQRAATSISSTMSSSGARTLYLEAELPSIRDAWLQAIRSVVVTADPTAPDQL